MDNYGTHKHEKVRRFLVRHRRFKVHPAGLAQQETREDQALLLVFGEFSVPTRDAMNSLSFAK
jgi:hypothetical protein